MKSSSGQTGFTLIEALVAFVILTVGVLGALLFHANLLRDSGESKIRMEAISIAERFMEDARLSLASASSSSEWQSGLSGLIPSSITDGKYSDLYTLTTTTVAAPDSSTSNIYRLSISVSSAELSSPVALSSYYGWLDPANTISIDESGTGNTPDYDGDIPVPTGTLRELPRIEVVDVNSENVDTDGSRGNMYVYSGTNDSGDIVDKVAIRVDDNTFVQLAELTSPDNEIFLITGRIFNHGTIGNASVHRFGNVWGETKEPADISAYEAVDFDNDGSPDAWFENDIIDIQATGGANCVITRYENFTETVKVSGKDKVVGKWADYLCVAGSGWNGTIKPYRRFYDAGKSSELELDGSVCAPKNRSYRYYILEMNEGNDPDDLQREVVSLGLSNTRGFFDDGADSQKLFELASVSGQSGLVRFYRDDNETVSASSESVRWGSYFFQNPNYIIDPSYLSPANPGDSLSYPDAILSYADVGGYKSPKVTSVTSAAEPVFSEAIAYEYEVMFPGDISHQNFYLSESTEACETVLTSQIFPDDPYTYINEFLSPTYLVSAGQPGFGGTDASGFASGYIPIDMRTTSFLPDFQENDFNTYPLTESRTDAGVLILGFTLATDSINGVLFFTSGASYSIDDFEIAGNPEPVVSITCDFLDEEPNFNTSTGNLEYKFACAVPVNWKGDILAYNSPSELAGCTNMEATVSSALVSETEINSENYIEISSRIDESAGRNSFLYYYETEFLSDPLASVAAVSDFRYLTFESADLTEVDPAAANVELGFGANCTYP